MKKMGEGEAMSGIGVDTVVPIRATASWHKAEKGQVRDAALRRYRVTAFYDYPPVERSVTVQAEDPQRAMVKALLQGRVPALFRKDEYGWLLPVSWHPRLAGGQRWPTVAGRNVIVWGDKLNRSKLIFNVDEIEC
jgi:hypothetical protein